MSYFLSGIKGLNENYYRTYYDYNDVGIKKYGYYYTDRQQIIYILKNFLDNNAFDHYYSRWYRELTSELNRYEQVKKIYNPYGYMDKIISELVLLSPMLKNFNTTSKNKLSVLKKSLNQADWLSLNKEIIQTLEMEGDFFAYWYYETSNSPKKDWVDLGNGKWENPIPRLKVLESEDMVDITLDKNNIPTAYKYKKRCMDETINETNGEVKRENYEVEMIFKKGYIRVNDPFNYPKEGFSISMNKEWESDIIRIIHIPSFKSQRDKFSQIPATKYIDPILILDALTTDLRYINKLAGFPIAREYDSEIDWNNSSIMPGGRIVYNSTEKALSSNKQGYTDVQQITNNLQTIQDEQSLIDSVLYKKIGLIREKLEQEIGNSDSSRVVSQLRLLLENKFEKYCKNIAKGLEPYFKSVLISTGNYTKSDEKSDKNYTFAMPDLFINTSIYDDLTITNMKLAIGLTTMAEEWDKQGLTEQEKTTRLKNINKEILMKNKDISINNATDTAMNGQGSKIDNQFKQNTNLDTSV